jgi:MYXO-CTERM domain-containing protein
MKPLAVLSLALMASPALAHDIGAPHAHTEGATGLWAGLVLILMAGTAALWRRR